VYVCFGFTVHYENVITLSKVTLYVVFNENVIKFCILDVLQIYFREKMEEVGAPMASINPAVVPWGLYDPSPL
jgi:hypothetical protein